MAIASANKMDHARRGFITGNRVSGREPKRPPWTDEARIAAKCTRCEACVYACPEGVLKDGAGGFPEFAAAHGSGQCTFCGVCAAVCMEDVFDPTRARPWTLIAMVDTGSCLAYAGIHCSSCSDSCDVKAIRMSARIGGPPQPNVREERCTGCGACASACPGDAISLLSDERSKDVA